MSPVKSSRFTLIELLLVVTIIIILAGMLLPVIGKAREKGRRASCISNIKQLTSSALMYAGDFGGQFMQTSQAGGDYLNDQEIDVVDSIQEYGATRQMLFCPSNLEMNSPSVWGATATYRGTGYFSTFIRQAGSLSTSTLVDSEWLTRIVTAGNSEEMTMFADIMYSDSSKTDFTRTSVYTATSNHKGAVNGLPDGGHSSYLDGHAEWLQFPNATERVTSSGIGCWF